MSDNKIRLSKEVGIATAVGAGLGALHGIKHENVLANSFLGAGVGALVGLFGKHILTEVVSHSPSEPQKSPDNN